MVQPILVRQPNKSLIKYLLLKAKKSLELILRAVTSSLIWVVDCGSHKLLRILRWLLANQKAFVSRVHKKQEVSSNGTVSQRWICKSLSISSKIRTTLGYRRRGSWRRSKTLAKRQRRRKPSYRAGVIMAQSCLAIWIRAPRITKPRNQIFKWALLRKEGNTRWVITSKTCQIFII